MNEFPILDRLIHGKRLVYLDNASTTQKPQVVINAIVKYYQTNNANIHRGIYTLSEESTLLYEQARMSIAKLVNVPAPQLILTSGTTDSLNLIAHGIVLQKDDEILLTPLEHHANIVPWQEAAKRSGAKTIFCNLNDDYTINVADLKARMNEKTKILAITHLSNVTGAITPLADIISFAKQKNIIVVVDGAQAVAHMNVDIAALGCDFYAFSSHKMYGPTGIGALYMAKDQLNMSPYRTGGDMIDDVTETGAQFATNEVRRFEAGTPNIAGAIGMGAAAEFLIDKDLKKINEYELNLARNAYTQLQQIEGVYLYGGEPQSGIISFNIDGIHPHDVAQLLDDDGICIRSGKHCAHPLLARMKTAATNRISLGIYNTQDDVSALISSITKVIKVFS